MAQQSAVSISDEVADVLRRSAVDGNVVRLPAGQLPRPIYTATDKALVALGGKWDRRAGGHVFANDPAEKLAAALDSGKAVDDLLTRKKRLQLFETPADLADKLVSALGDIEGLVCLEPSAGHGRIVQALALRDPSRVVAVEIDADNADALLDQNRAHKVIVGDFLTMSPTSLACDVVAMNPPFTRNQDVRHVRHAYACLIPGGRLAAIVGEHGFIGREREAVEWREWLAEVGAQIGVIPAGAFKESGTNIQTRMIVINKALPA
jgi:SAM-dependent methyltransferase